MNEPFYASGLRFSCTRCSSCCRHNPGYVFLSRSDIEHLSSALALTPEKFTEIYCRVIDIGGFTRLSLNEKKNYDCIFWENGGCSVYTTRPFQCISFPFWNSNLSSLESWREAALTCPGVNRGKLFSREEIDTFLEHRLQNPLL